MDVLLSTCSEYVPRKTTSSSSIHKNSLYKSRRPIMRRRTKINKMRSTVNYSKSQKLIRELIDIEFEYKSMSSHNEERLHVNLSSYPCLCLAGAVANVADSNRCNPKVPSSIPAGGKDFP